MAPEAPQGAVAENRIDHCAVLLERLYDAYQEIVAGFSQVERDDMFRGTAAAWFGLR